MSTSIKVSKDINMSGEDIVFIGTETGEFAETNIEDTRKVNMAGPMELALNTIPATNVVTGDIFQLAKMNFTSRILGSTSTVVGSHELFKPENLGENTEKNFGESAYHTNSGVHERKNQEVLTFAAANQEAKGVLYGWEEKNGKWKYRDGEKYVKGWKEIGGLWYYLDESEYMVTGWKQISGKWYYFKTKKDAEVSGKGYGYMWKGWKQIDGKWYFMHSDGRLAVSEWRQGKDGKWYYLRSNGEMAVSQWRKSSNGKSYYLGADGAMVKSQTLEIDGKKYQFDENGEHRETQGSTGNSIEQNKKIIWNYLRNEMGLSKVQAAAVMGNIQHESGFSPTNAQDSYGYAGVDNKDYIDKYSSKDGVGWGLVQWTFSTRKQGLLDYANKNGKSVGNLYIQLEYLNYELNKDFKSSFNKFKELSEIDIATEYFCNEIEKPGTPNIKERKKYARKILDEFSNN